MPDVVAIYRLSPMQQLMHAHVAREGPSNSLISQFEFELTGPLDGEKLKCAWDVLVARHDALRTCFVGEGDKLRQVVLKSATTDLQQFDLRELAVDERESARKSGMLKDVKLGLSINSAPLMSLMLFRVDEFRWTMIWKCHHLILDRWCIPTILHELCEAYECEPTRRRGRHQFGDYIKWIDDQSEEEASNYWAKTLTDVCCPTSSMQKPRTTDRPQSLCFDVDHRETERLRQIAAERQATLGSLFHVLLAISIGRVLGEDDVLFATTVAGRPGEMVGVDEMVGSFTNNVPTRIRMPESVSFSELLRTTHEGLLTRQPFEHCSLSQIFEWVPEFSGGLDVLLVFQSRQQQPPTLGDIRLTPVASGIQSAFPVTIGVVDGDSISVSIQAEARGRIDVTRLCESLRETVSCVAKGIDPLSHEPRPVHRNGSGTGENSCASASVAGRTGTEKTLAEIWTDILGTNDFGVRDDFFDLGGRSFMLPSLLARIEQATGRPQRMSNIYSTPTIEQLAAQIDGPIATASSLLVSFQTSGSTCPMFWAPQDSGEVGGEWTRLGPKQPSYGLRLPGWDGSEEPLCDVEAIAVRLVSEIRSIQPSGPYAIGGYCFGATVAFAIAQQLEAEDEEVALLALMDSYCPGSDYRRFSFRPVQLIRMLRCLPRWFVDTMQLSREQQLRHVQLKVRTLWLLWMARFGAKDKPTAEDHAELMDDRDEIAKAVRVACFKAFEGFTPQGVTAATTLFRAEVQPLVCSHDPQMGWSEVCSGKLQACEISGNHLTIASEPNVKAVRDVLVDQLAGIRSVNLVSQ